MNAVACVVDVELAQAVCRHRAAVLLQQVVCFFLVGNHEAVRGMVVMNAHIQVKLFNCLLKRVVGVGLSNR